MRKKGKAREVRNFSVRGRTKADKPFHYTACGLDNIYLHNGFSVRETPYGKGVAIDDVEGLHETIAWSLIQKDGSLTGSELRFLRNLLGMTQAELARRLSSEEQNIGRYERGQAIPGPTDKLVRTMVYVCICSDEEYESFLKHLNELIEKSPSGRAPVRRMSFEQQGREWHSRHAS